MRSKADQSKFLGGNTMTTNSDGLSRHRALEHKVRQSEIDEQNYRPRSRLVFVSLFFCFKDKTVAIRGASDYNRLTSRYEPSFCLK